MSDITTSASPRPAVVDDDGTGRTGTRWNKAFNDDWTDAINEQVASVANPTVKPVDTIDEVVAARGSEASLTARLDTALNADGTPKAAAFTAYATVAQSLGGMGFVNLVSNDDFSNWVDGDSSAPEGDVLAGAAASVARCGTGLADTNRKVGDFCAKVTRAGANASLSRTLLAGSSFTRADFIKSLYAPAGAWVKCSTPNVARVGVYDGVGYTYSSYHTGGGAWEWLPVTRQINVAATSLVGPNLYVDNADVAAYISGRCLVLSDQNVTLPCWIGCPTVYGTIHFVLAGAVTVGARKGDYVPSRPGIVRDVQLYARTAPTGQALIVDVNTWDGVARTSMFATRPEISAAFSGGAQPDGLYARRCLRGRFGNTWEAGTEVSPDVDQVGSGVAGADVLVEVRVAQPQSLLEKFWSYNGPT
jgi:hypothetical protein